MKDYTSGILLLCTPPRNYSVSAQTREFYNISHLFDYHLFTTGVWCFFFFPEDINIRRDEFFWHLKDMWNSNEERVLR